MIFYPSFNDSNYINFNIIEYYQDSILDLNEDGLFSYNNGEYQKALYFIDKYLSDNPNGSLMIAFKAFVLYKLGYLDDALFCCDVSLNIDDTLDFNWLCKSIILKKLKRKNDSLLCYKMYIFLKFKENLEVSNYEFYKDIIDLNIIADYNFTGKYENNYIDFEDLFTNENLNRLQENTLTVSQYKDILNKIRVHSKKILNHAIDENFIELENLDLLDKIILYTKVFSSLGYKSEGGELGEYNLNNIVLDDRLYDSDQILTLIHELAHHLLREIFEQSLMYMLNTSKTYLIELFISYILNEKEYMLMDEYCANKVQSRFTPYGYQEFDSYVKILNEYFDRFSDNQSIAIYSQLGNTFSKDILWIIEDYLDATIREEIKNQFKLDLNKKEDYNKLEPENYGVFTDDEKLLLLNDILSSGFEKIYNNPNDFKEILNEGK